MGAWDPPTLASTKATRKRGWRETRPGWEPFPLAMRFSVCVPLVEPRRELSTQGWPCGWQWGISSCSLSPAHSFSLPAQPPQVTWHQAGCEGGGGGEQHTAHHVRFKLIQCLAASKHVVPGWRGRADSGGGVTPRALLLWAWSNFKCYWNHVIQMCKWLLHLGDGTSEEGEFELGNVTWKISIWELRELIWKGKRYCQLRVEITLLVFFSIPQTSSITVKC